MTTITKTIGTSSRNYSTMTAWEADLGNGAIYTAGDDAVGECYNDSNFDEQIDINTTGTPDLNSITLKAASGQGHNGTAGTGVRMVHTTSTSRSFLTRNLYNPALIQQIEINSNGYTGGANMNSNLAVTATWHRMLIHGRAANCIVASSTASADTALIRSVVYDNAGIGINYVSNGAATGTCSLIGCVVSKSNNDSSGTDYQIRVGTGQTGATCNIRNCVAMGPTGTAPDFSFGSTPLGTHSHNMSSDTTAVGTDALISKTTANQFVSTTGGSEDYHLKSGADAIDSGVDLGTTPTWCNIDIDGYDADAGGNTWDRGAHEWGDAAAGQPAMRRLGMPVYGAEGMRIY